MKISNDEEFICRNLNETWTLTKSKTWKNIHRVFPEKAVYLMTLSQLTHDRECAEKDPLFATSARLVWIYFSSSGQISSCKPKMWQDTWGPESPVACPSQRLPRVGQLSSLRHRCTPSCHCSLWISVPVISLRGIQTIFNVRRLYV
jgi:hypothetical protein